MQKQNNSQPPKRICLGKIKGVHGVRGLVTVLPYGDDPKLLESLSPLYIGQAADTTLSLTLKSKKKGEYLAAIEGITDRTEAEKLKNTELWVAREKLPEIKEEGRYYYEDLKGLSALDESGEIIGKVSHVDDFGAGDLLDITLDKGGSFMLPFNEEAVINVDLTAGTITLRDYERFIL